MDPASLPGPAFVSLNLTTKAPISSGGEETRVRSSNLLVLCNIPLKREEFPINK